MNECFEEMSRMIITQNICLKRKVNEKKILFQKFKLSPCILKAYRINFI